MTKIAGVIIVYFPDFNKLIFNIDSYINNIERLFVVFNSPVKPEDINRLQSKYSKIQLIFNSENFGIAQVLNKTALQSLNLGYEWLLTMDQDSYFRDDLFFTTFLKNDTKNVAIYSPTPVTCSEIKIENSDDTEEVLGVITSGNLLNLKIWKKLGGFEEKLFIDEVDNDYCLKAVSNGFKIISFTNIPLIHELGRKKEASLLNKKYIITIHPPVRSYYIFRNNLYVFSKYKNVFPKFVRNRKIMLLKNFVKILLFSSERVENIRYIIRGIRDYFNNSYGPYKEHK